MKIDFYDTPTRNDFKSKKFFALTKKHAKNINSLQSHIKKAEVIVGKSWTTVRRTSDKSKRKNRTWGLKIYICIPASHYWNAVEALLKNDAEIGLDWKYENNSIPSSRPDRIVMYPNNLKQLRMTITKISKILRRFPKFSITNAGFLKRGIYWGADPIFLEKTSWRFYRSLSLIWAYINKKEIRSQGVSITQWLRQMNISPTSGAPLSIDENLSNSERMNTTTYIKGQWKRVQTLID